MIDHLDIRIVIDSFLDHPALHSLILACKAPAYINSKKYLKYIDYTTKILKKKKKECKEQWNYHLRSPDEIRLIENLYSITRKNLKKLELSGYIWDEKTNIWLVPRRNKKPGSDIMISGYCQGKGKVQYWRHETKHPGAGQTLLIWDEETPNGIKRNRVLLSKLVST